ncbi:MAG: DUF4139 domain-containing protein [Myxococcota bacterium]
MKNDVSFLAVLSVGALSCGGVPSHTVHSPESLPVERVVLFQNGMAYVERRGEVDSQTFDLRTRPEGIHDVLKSLSVVDHEGGAITGVRVLNGDDDARLRIGLSSEGSDDVSVAYVAEASGWRPTYRVVDLGEGRVRLQGLAVVDNPSGEDWNAVRLALSTEVPLAFRYEVGTARVTERPTLDSNGRLRLQPVAPIVAGTQTQNAYGVANIHMPEFNERAGEPVRNGRSNLNLEQQAATPAAEGQNALSVIDAQDPSEGFTLETPERLTLQAGESGLVPFVDEATAGQRVLLYKPAPVQGGRPGASHRHPYHAVMFENPLESPLLTGPVTVYADGSFQGDGVTAAIPAGAHAFVAYAMNPSVHIDASRSQRQDEVQGLSVVGGHLRVRLRHVIEHQFRATGSLNNQRLYVFARKENGFEAEGLPEGAVVTGAGYFVPVGAEAVTVRLVHPETQTVDLSANPRHAFVPALLELVEAQGADVAALRRIVDRLETIDRERVQHQRDLDVHERALVQRREGLAALRDVPGNAPLRAQIARGVAEGVRAVDASTRAVVALQAEEVALRQDWYARLRILDF